MPQIPLHKRGAVVAFALVDAADFERLSVHKWSLSSSKGRRSRGYAETYVRGASPRTRMMHREVVGAKPGDVVDHVNLDTLDNRRENLRVCTPSQSLGNRRAYRGARSPFIGVSFSEHAGRWRASVTFEGRRHYLGYFDTEREAALARDAAALDLYGEFARLNFPRLEMGHAVCYVEHELFVHGYEAEMEAADAEYEARRAARETAPVPGKGRERTAAAAGVAPRPGGGRAAPVGSNPAR